MHSRFFIYLLIMFLAGTLLPASFLNAQAISDADIKLLESKEDSLKNWSANMVFSESPAERFRSDSHFVRTLVRALRIKNSFYYAFDSLNISRIYAPDSSFRIFTWQLKKDEYVYHQKGAIQMHTADGSLKLIPLYDRSMFTNPLQGVRRDTSWIGAIYYRIIKKEHNGQAYYTLLGFDDFSAGSNKKWMEVMYFDEQQKPVFGGKFFSFKNDTVKKADQFRFNIEYKKEAKTFFNYDPDKDMVIFDHLESEDGESERKESFIPVGEFEAFKWQNGQWLHVPKIDFDFRLKDGEFPREATIYDEAGNVNEAALEEASRRNFEKDNKGKSGTNDKGRPATEKPPVKKTDPVKKKGNN